MMIKVEKLLNWLIWGGSVFYALFCFAKASKLYRTYLPHNDFKPGWFVGSYKDVSDNEWTILSKAFKAHILWVVGHILLSQIVARCCPKEELRLLFSTVYGSIATIFILNPLALGLIWINILVALVIHALSKPILCYLSFASLLFILHKDAFFNLKRFIFENNDHQEFLFMVSVAWLNAKCLSFSLDRIRANQNTLKSKVDLLRIFAYCMYFPPFFTGPIHQYFNFVEDTKKTIQMTFAQFIGLTLKMARYLFWALALELLLHYIYCSSVQYIPELGEQFDAWTLCGLGYALVSMFYLKYLVIYGLVGVLAEMDGIRMPPPPKCVSRIHLCTYLWRTFDRGLHIWLTTYFYKPLNSIKFCNSLIGNNWSLRRRLFAGAVCFGFVCLWHGFDHAVGAWCSMNFLGISVEMIGSAFGETRIWSEAQSHLSLTWEKRLNTAITAPFFATMIISNIFFLSNWDLGLVFVHRILLTYPLPLLFTLVVMYAGCNVSIEYLQMETANERNKSR